MIDLGLIAAYAPLMLAGLGVTVAVCALASVLAVGLGLALALALLARNPLLRLTARAFVEAMRGVPVLVILFLLYYGGPSFGLRLDPAPAGVIGLGLYGAAFFAEIFRGGFLSIPRGQIEAARMVGLSRRAILRRIELPQMALLVTPPMTNQLILLIKESALVSIITIDDLTKNATRMSNETFAVFEPFLMAAVLYWLLVEAVARLGAWAEARAAGAR